MLFAIDTNPLIDWAEGYGDTPDCFNLIKQRIPGVSIIVPPTVLHELGHFAKTNAKNLGSYAIKALELIQNEGMISDFDALLNEMETNVFGFRMEFNKQNTIKIGFSFFI